MIVWINGAVDDLLGFQWEDNYVITEDHYIDYMSGLGRGGCADTDSHETEEIELPVPWLHDCRLAP